MKISVSGDDQTDSDASPDVKCLLTTTVFGVSPPYQDKSLEEGLVSRIRHVSSTVRVFLLVSRPGHSPP